MKKYCYLVFFMISLSSYSQTLNLPNRNPLALSGSQVVSSITNLSLQNRENFIYNEVINGNVPDFYRNLVPIYDSVLLNGVYKRITYYTIPDYLALGSDADYFLCPMTPILAQKIANQLSCILPTSKMVDRIWAQATVKMSPQTIPASGQMTTVPVFNQHNTMVKNSRQSFLPAKPLGSLVGGDKKDVIISNMIYTTPAPARVIIYGWHYTNGSNIQPKYAGHSNTYADYSHGIRLIQNQVWVDGVSMLASDVLRSSTLHTLLSNEGVINNPYYPDTANPNLQVPNVPLSFSVTGYNSTSIKINIKLDPNVEQYQVYLSNDGITFNSPLMFDTNQIILSGLNTNTIYYVRITASNLAGTSVSSEVLAAVPSSQIHKVLIVNGFDRSISSNTKDFVRQHGASIWAYSLPFSSATNEALVNNLIVMNAYQIVDYILGEESTADETFSLQEQVIVQNFLDQGGDLFVSGAEIGWDLDHLGTTTDQSFYNDYLKSNYVADAPNNVSSTYYSFQGTLGNEFQSIPTLTFDNGANGIYNVKYPDEITAMNGANAGFEYSNLSNKYAGIYFHGQFPGSTGDSGKLVYLGVPFETVYPSANRDVLMFGVLDYFLPTLSFSTSIKESTENIDLLVYPNPFEDKIKIRLNHEGDYHFQLITIEGKLVLEGMLMSKLQELDLSEIPSGAYLFKLISKTNQKIVKILKR